MQKVIERSLNLLAFLLTADRPVTADEVRTTVAGYGQESDEAFRRTFERDKDLLRRLGVPLQLAPTDGWEVEFGYVIPDEDWALEDPGLTDEERTAVLLAAQAVRFGGQAAGADALFKLGGAPSGSGGEPLAADLGLNAELLEVAFRGVSERRVAVFEYSGRARRIHPYGLVHRRGHWYLVGPEAEDRDVVKAFRLDRAGTLTVEEPAGVFDRPAEFDPSRAIPEAPWEAGADELYAKVRFDARVAWLAQRALSAGAEIERADDGSILVETLVAAPEVFIGWIIGFDDAAVILEPPELRRAFLDRVQGVA